MPIAQQKTPLYKAGLYHYVVKNLAATYSPRDKTQVPSAMRGLTTLFGMGRGEHPRQCHR
jgi:hypothetical protein